MPSIRNAEARSRATTAPLRGRPPRELAELLRVVERLLASGRGPDVVERAVAGWVREAGIGRGDVPGILARVGVRGARTSHLADRIVGHARRPGPGPATIEPMPVPTPLWRLRSADWFAHLGAVAAGQRFALAALGLPTRAPAPAMPSVRTFDHVASHGAGAIVPRSRTSIAPQVLPGVFALQAKGALGAAVAPDVHQVLRRLGRGRPLDRELRQRLAPRLAALGRPIDLEHVMVHDDASAAALCAELGAQAFALGRHVAFAAGRFRPEAQDGLALLAHELTHVWQQAHLAVGHGVVRAPALEADADRVAGVFGRAAAAGAPTPRALATPGREGSALQACGDDETNQRARGQAPSAASSELPAPRATDLDGLLREARAAMSRARLRPSALFIVTDRITAYDAELRARGTWTMRGPCPLAAGYWFDGAAGIEAWSDLSAAQVARITGGHADDLWVVGPQSGATSARPAADDPHLRVRPRTSASAPVPARA
ncbi:MAG: DUF4157 domain-containing protein [Myxococcota bacterium]